MEQFVGCGVGEGVLGERGGQLRVASMDHRSVDIERLGNEGAHLGTRRRVVVWCVTDHVAAGAAAFVYSGLFQGVIDKQIFTKQKDS